MPVEITPIEGLLVLRNQTFADERGWFHETMQLDALATAIGREPRFLQSNHARSNPGVLRGFHAEPWDKLVYVASGQVLAVVADLRPDSATFGAHETFLLGDDTERVRLFVSAGLGNAYCVLGDQPADYLYDVTEVWRPGVDKREVAWDDPTIAAPWPLDAPLLSEADRAAPTLRERFPDHPVFTSGRQAAP